MGGLDYILLKAPHTDPDFRSMPSFPSTVFLRPVSLIRCDLTIWWRTIVYVPECTALLTLSVSSGVWFIVHVVDDVITGR